MEQGVRRWLFNSNSWKPSPAEFSFCLSLLPPSQHSEVLKFINFEDQKRALISRLMQHMLIHVLLDIPYADIVILRTKEGKPYLANPLSNTILPNLNFSVSHHGEYVGIASEPLCIVGLDIMACDLQRNETAQQYINNFRSCFTQTEWRIIHSAGPQSDPLINQFNRFWCMKEAYIKALGIGLGFDLQRAEFYYGDGDRWSPAVHLRLDGVEMHDWSFHLDNLGNDHWACVARGPPAAATKSFRQNLRNIELDSETMAAILQGPNPPFLELSIHDLIPRGKSEEFEDQRKGNKVPNIL